MYIYIYLCTFEIYIYILYLYLYVFIYVCIYIYICTIVLKIYPVEGSGSLSQKQLYSSSHKEIFGVRADTGLDPTVPDLKLRALVGLKGLIRSPQP